MNDQQFNADDYRHDATKKEPLFFLKGISAAKKSFYLALYQSKIFWVASVDLATPLTSNQCDTISEDLLEFIDRVPQMEFKFILTLKKIPC